MYSITNGPSVMLNTSTQLFDFPYAWVINSAACFIIFSEVLRLLAYCPKPSLSARFAYALLCVGAAGNVILPLYGHYPSDTTLVTNVGIMLLVIRYSKHHWLNRFTKHFLAVFHQVFQRRF